MRVVRSTETAVCGDGGGFKEEEGCKAQYKRKRERERKRKSKGSRRVGGDGGDDGGEEVGGFGGQDEE